MGGLALTILLLRLSNLHVYLSMYLLYLMDRYHALSCLVASDMSPYHTMKGNDETIFTSRLA